MTKHFHACPSKISMLSLDFWVALGVDMDLGEGVDKDFCTRFATGLIQIAMVLVGIHRSALQTIGYL